MSWDAATIAGLRQQQGLRGAAEVVLIEGAPPFVLDLDGPIYDDNPLLADALAIPQEAEGAPTAAARAERNHRILHWYDDLASACIVSPRYYHRDQVARGVVPGDGLTIRDLVVAPGALGRLVDTIFPPEVLAPLKSFRGEPAGGARAPTGEGLRDATEPADMPDGAATNPAVARRGRVGQRPAGRTAAGTAGPARDRTPRAARGTAG